MLIWLAHFLRFREFGFYEDDLSFIIRPMHLSLRAFALRMLGEFRSWHQGRPLHFVIPQVVAYVSARLGWFHLNYLIAYAFLLANTLLVHRLAKHFNIAGLPELSALAFALYPADTTHIFLTHALGIQPALTMILIASLLYLSGRRWLAYAFAGLTIVTHEPEFFVLLFVPLIRERWQPGMKRELLVHGFWSGMIALTALAIRLVVNDTRLTQLASGGAGASVLWREMVSLGNGMGTALFAFVRAPMIVGRGLPAGRLVGFFIAALVLLVVGWGWYRTARRGIELEAPAPEWSSIARASLAAVLVFASGYLMAFAYFPANQLEGRITRVHIAGSVGGAMLVGVAVIALLRLVSGRRVIRSALIAATLVYFAMLVAYQGRNQREYARAWQIQQWFWSEVAELIPDATTDTVILVQLSGFPQTEVIRANSWADVFYLEHIYDFPAAWDPPPRLVTADYEKYFVADGELPEIQIEELRPTFPLIDGNVIVLAIRDGDVVRLDGELIIEDRVIQLRPITADAVPAWQPGRLHSMLIVEGENQSP